MNDPAGRLQYRSRIDLTSVTLPASEAAPETASPPDRRDGLVYLYDDELKLAVEVAMTTQRPLLLRGEAGSGKSSLAAFLARNLNWRYYEQVVTARTQAQDFLWRYDHVRRLRDAQVGHVLDDSAYVEPGVLWWAFDRASASRRGKLALDATAEQDNLRPPVEPFAELNVGRDPTSAVVLIDEIDKADPDVPNSLLVPLGSMDFVVTETAMGVRRSRPDDKQTHRRGAPVGHLVIVTTNEERDLPQAFLRRCVVHRLGSPDVDKLVRIAGMHFPAVSPHEQAARPALFKAIAERLMQFRKEAADHGARPASTAEYLDAVAACRALGIGLDTPAWRHVEQIVFRKLREAPEVP